MNPAFETIKPKKYHKPVAVGDLSKFGKEFESSPATKEDLRYVEQVKSSSPVLEVVGYVDPDGNYYNTKQYKLLICKKNLEPVFRLKSGDKELLVI